MKSLLTKKTILFISLLIMAMLITSCKKNATINEVTPATKGTEPSTTVSTPAPPNAPKDAPAVHIGVTNWSSGVGFLIPAKKLNSAVYIRGKTYECFKEDGYIVYCESKPSLKCNSGDSYCEQVGMYMYCQNNQWRSYMEAKCTEWSDKSSAIRLDEASQKKLDAAVKAQGNAALAGIADLTCLTSLNLNNLDLSNPVTITDITALTNLINLKSLYIGNHEITDISPIVKLKRLTNLNIFNNPITDITPLINLPNLIDVSLDRIDADTSDSECLKLKSMLPEVKVDC